MVCNSSRSTVCDFRKPSFCFSRDAVLIFDSLHITSCSFNRCCATSISRPRDSLCSASCCSWASYVSVNLRSFPRNSSFSLKKCSRTSSSASIFSCTSLMACWNFSFSSACRLSSSSAMRWFSLEMLDFCCCSSRQVPSSCAFAARERCTSIRKRSRSLAESSWRFCMEALCSSWPLASSILCTKASWINRILCSSVAVASSRSSCNDFTSAAQSAFEGGGGMSVGSSIADGLTPSPLPVAGGQKDTHSWIGSISISSVVSWASTNSAASASASSAPLAPEPLDLPVIEPPVLSHFSSPLGTC
mmetsp:Transcript_87061/g.244161  ORF Transcript_87061/g.244161 Transcript_87061/m.244161 type:complete len:303 (+) Transcript_87061:632-1540(+)